MSSDLEEEAGEIRLEERLAAPMAVALARLLGEAEESSAGPCRQRTILDVARQLSQIGRESLPGEWVRMERERREEKLSEICQKERQEAGAGEARDLSGTLINLAESRRIKPNQTCGGGGWVDGATAAKRGRAGRKRRRRCGGGTFAPDRGCFLGLARIKPDQTKSNQIKPAGGSVPRLLTSAAMREGVVAVGLFASYRGYFLGIARIKPDQGESNQIKPAGGSVPRLLTSAATREGVVVVGLFASYRGYFRGIARIKPDQGESNQIKPGGSWRLARFTW
jgi:hypothetical protein